MEIPLPNARTLLLIPAALALLLLTACDQTETAAPEELSQKGTHETSERFGAWGIDTDGMDNSVRPGDDFHGFVNGSWLQQFDIPADKARYSNWDILRERATEKVDAIIKDLAANSNEPGTPEQQVGDYYASYMDTDTLDTLGANPILTELKRISNLREHSDLTPLLGDIHTTSPFAVGIIPDPKDTNRYAVILGQDGLGMPDRDYYLNNDERFQGFRAAYLNYIDRLFELAGQDPNRERSERILALETRLANAHKSKTHNRDINNVYNPMSPAELQALAPQLDWPAVLQQLGIADQKMLIVSQPETFRDSAALLAETPLQHWREYFSFHLLRNSAGNLSGAFEQASFEFFSRTLRGIQEPRARWKRGSDRVNRALGEVIGKIYVERHFPPAAKASMDELVGNLRAAFEERLRDNSWMDAPTRTAALNKLATFEPRIGYPTRWQDYNGLIIDPADLFGNTRRVADFNWALRLQRLPGEVDRELWSTPPQTVNAFYNSLLNQITFPAGVLQPPFFDPEADAAVNYGAIGAVIGHEIGHGFDDQGRRFDEKGLLRDWWSESSEDNFQSRADRLVAQFSSFEPVTGVFVNGELTLGENIGDLGGVEMAFAAYQRHIEQSGEPAPVLDGFSGEQRFFMSWAQVWRGKVREAAQRQSVLTNVHSPMKYRANGVVRNIDAWYEAFGIPRDAALYLAPKDRVSIW